MGRLLIIEDDPELLRLLSIACTRAGHEVTSAPDGALALRAMGRTPVDLVITDVCMAEGDAAELIPLIRGRCAGVKIIAISGALPSACTDLLIAASRLGADDALAKPFHASALLRAADRLLGDAECSRTARPRLEGP